MEEKLNVLAQNLCTEGGYLIYNSNAFKRSDIAKLGDKTVYVKDIPSMGWSVVRDYEDTNHIEVKENSIISDYFILQWNQNGNIVSLYDRIANRELIAQGCEGNCLKAYEDKPFQFEAWEIEPCYYKKEYAINDVKSICEICDGVRKGIRIIRRYESSTIKQDIWLYQHLQRIDFEMVIDWKEKDTLVKAIFPLNIISDKVTSEIQFGNVERVTHNNTSWDEAKFEMCMHKWIDLADNGYGVSILNDCKYGYSCHGSEVGITLLKSAVDPNPDADKEIHKLTYSLYPHKGRYHEAETVKQAYNLNNPLLVRNIGRMEGKLPEKYSFVETDKANVIVETVKKCEFDDCIIIRLYECHNMCCCAKLKFGFSVKNVFLCDMEENVLQKLDVQEKSVWLDVHNFEILTLKIDNEWSLTGRC